MNDYESRKAQLKKDKCKGCDGIGKCDDADFGDISCNEWECPECKGSGIVKDINACQCLNDNGAPLNECSGCPR